MYIYSVSYNEMSYMCIIFHQIVQIKDINDISDTYTHTHTHMLNSTLYFLLTIVGTVVS